MIDILDILSPAYPFSFGPGSTTSTASASAGIAAAATASVVKTLNVVVTAVAGAGLGASATAVSDMGPLNLGRFRVGEVVRFPMSGVPDVAPTANFNPIVAGVGPIPFSPTGESGLEGSFLIAGLPGLGMFTVTAQVMTGGAISPAVYQFEVVGGGDSGGRVIAMAAVSRPGGTKVLAHLESGRAVQGNTPRI